MISIDEINKEINNLENKDCTTYDICKKLAILYTVKNNFKPIQKNINNMELDMSKPIMK